MRSDIRAHVSSVSFPTPLRQSRRSPLLLSLLLGAGLSGRWFFPSPDAPPTAAVLADGSPCVGVQRHVSLPLTELGNAPYVRMDGQVTEFIGGLYPGGSNTRPPAMEAAGQAIAAQILPLDANGQVDRVNGRIVMISLGMSNTQMEFQAFMDEAHRDPRVNPTLTIVSGALGGQTADRWVDPEARGWVEVDARLRHAGVTPLQVEVAWVKQTLTRGGDFPGKALELQSDLETILHNLLFHYPNLRIVFLSSRTRSYLYDRGLSPEPAAFETGFAVKWLIEAQLNGDPDLNYDPARGPVTAPFLSWGPYLWIDGLNPRSDGMTWTPEDLAEDCTHPSSSGIGKVEQMLMSFFTTDTLTTPWFLSPLLQPPVSPTIAAPTATVAAPSPTVEASPTAAAIPPTSTPTAPAADLAPAPIDAALPIGGVIGVLVIGIGAAAYLLRPKR